MLLSKLRPGARTILAALLCVLIGLAIGFVVLFSLAYIDKNNTYQKNAEAYTSGQYPRADMLRAKKYLEAGDIGDDVVSHLNGKYGAGELTEVVQHILNDNPSGVKFYTDEQIIIIVGFGAQMQATNNFNSVLGVDVDKRLLPLKELFKPATWRENIK